MYEIFDFNEENWIFLRSFPLWERGLKQLSHSYPVLYPRRSPCGNVD